MNFGVTDLRAAKLLHHSDLQAAHLVTFLAQQRVEKSLKACLALHGKDFPYSHDFGELIRLSSELYSWPAEVTQTKTMTRYAVDKRYPALVDEPVSESEAREALDKAEKAVEQIRSELESGGLTVPEPET